MTNESRVSVRRSVAAAAAAGLLLAGAAGAYLLMRENPGAGRTASTPQQSAPAQSREQEAVPSQGGTSAGGTSTDNATLPDVVVPIAEDVMQRADIAVGAVSAGPSTTTLRLPGVVEPNGYRQVAVTPLVSGRITRISSQLGDRVSRGQTMAQVYSPELADAHTRYVSAHAMLDAHERELERTEKLVQIGAASRQELERIHAEHAAQTAEVQAARARLQLLGVPAAAFDRDDPENGLSATTNVPAPIGGIVTERLANTGLNVDPSTKLFTVVDLSSVWVIADLYEKDFSRVPVGSPATVATAAYPGLALQGRVSYIDPQVSAATRTAKVRVEVPNPRHELRLGMYGDVQITGPAGPGAIVAVPRSAVQNVADRQVVYLADPERPGTFTEREVRLVPSTGDQAEVLSGLKPGDVVVTRGSFFVRAERERLGLRSSSGAAPAHAAHGRVGATQPDAQIAQVRVGERGFEPSRLTLRAGVPARVTFVRSTDATCAKEIVFPSLGIKRSLPLNKPVVIEFTPAKGDVSFVCGMGMLSGTIVAE